MDLSEILSNPLFIPLLVSTITIIFNVVSLYWLQTRQYKIEYIIRNVEKTYIPLVKEIHDRLEYYNRFLEAPNSLKWNFDELKRIRKSELFEFIKSHDKELYRKLEHFHSEICPKFKRLDDLQKETRETIRNSWIEHLENIQKLSGNKRHARNFINDFFNNLLFIALLNGKNEEIVKAWKKQRAETKQYQDISPTFEVPEKEINTLIKMSKSEIGKLLNFYKELKNQLEKEVVNDLIPRLQKYIANPLSR